MYKSTPAPAIFPNTSSPEAARSLSIIGCPPSAHRFTMAFAASIHAPLRASSCFRHTPLRIASALLRRLRCRLQARRSVVAMPRRNLLADHTSPLPDRAQFAPGHLHRCVSHASWRSSQSLPLRESVRRSIVRQEALSSFVLRATSAPLTSLACCHRLKTNAPAPLQT
jgi:hypothetical protein